MSHGRHAPAGRPALTVTHVLREHAAETVARYGIGWRERGVLRWLTACRTAELGGHLEVCPGCAHEHPAYNSCMDRHCPQCQDGRRARWLATRAPRTLPVGHFQVVFPLPAELRPLAKAYPAEMYDLLLRVGSYVLQTLAEQRMGAQLGIFAVLHTWTRDLSYHPHVHFVVTAGGLSPDGTWVPARPNFLFPIAVMRKMYRGRLLDELRRMQAAGVIRGDVPKEVLYNKTWVVHVTPPSGRTAATEMLKYLARYVYGVGISDRRLVSYDGRTVEFRTRNGATVRLSGVEFTRRFAQHILPKRFRKVRYYGLYATASGPRLALAFERLGTTPPPARVPEPQAVDDDTEDHADRLADPEPVVAAAPLRPLCPACGLHRLISQPLPQSAPTARGPPWW